MRAYIKRGGSSIWKSICILNYSIACGEENWSEKKIRNWSDKSFFVVSIEKKVIERSEKKLKLNFFLSLIHSDVHLGVIKGNEKK